MAEKRRTIGMLVAAIIALMLGNARLWAEPVLETVRRPAVDADVDPDDPDDDGVLDWSSLTALPPHGFGQPLQSGQAVTFVSSFHAKAATAPGQLTRNCVIAWYQQGGEPGHETAPQCTDLSILQEPRPRVEVDKVVYDSKDPANPGDTIKVSFLVRNTGTTAFTNITLTDSYDTSCLRFVPLGIPLIAPDDPAGLEPLGEPDLSGSRLVDSSYPFGSLPGQSWLWL